MESLRFRDRPSSAPQPLPDEFVCKRGKWEDKNEVVLSGTATVNCIPITTTLATTTPLPTTTLNETTVPNETTVLAITTAQPKDNDSGRLRTNG